MRNLCYAQSQCIGQGTHLTLMHDVVSSRINRVIYQIGFMNLYEHERDLNSGRFKDFVREPQELRATIPMPKHLDPLRDKFQRMVEWIADNGYGPWSFEVIPHSVGDLEVAFTFADDLTGVAFMLAWR